MIPRPRLAPELLQKLDAYWRAANYLSVGQIYLCDNPLLRRPLALADVKHVLLGHGGTTPGQNFVYVHLNRVIKTFHGYPWLIHRLTYRRTNHSNFHVRGYKEEGTITTPFDMTVLNELDRFHLDMDTIDRLPQTGDRGVYLKQQLGDKLIEHKRYIAKNGQDLPEVRDWKWRPDDAPKANTLEQVARAAGARHG
jgi:phosphoketolase